MKLFGLLVGLGFGVLCVFQIFRYIVECLSFSSPGIIDIEDERYLGLRLQRRQSPGASLGMDPSPIGLTAPS